MKGKLTRVLFLITLSSCLHGESSPRLEALAFPFYHTDILYRTIDIIEFWMWHSCIPTNKLNNFINELFRVCFWKSSHPQISVYVCFQHFTMIWSNLRHKWAYRRLSGFKAWLIHYVVIVHYCCFRWCRSRAGVCYVSPVTKETSLA